MPTNGKFGKSIVTNIANQVTKSADNLSAVKAKLTNLAHAYRGTATDSANFVTVKEQLIYCIRDSFKQTALA